MKQERSLKKYKSPEVNEKELVVRKHIFKISTQGKIPKCCGFIREFFQTFEKEITPMPYKIGEK